MLSEHHESERSDLLSHIECLEKDIASLSSSSLAKEKENLRKDFEKTKTKLKDTESKLKNSMQDKTKLEVRSGTQFLTLVVLIFYRIPHLNYTIKF